MKQWLHRRAWLAAATLALLWHALHPLSAPLMARAHATAAGEPFAEICTTLGIKRLPLVPDHAALDLDAQAHGPQQAPAAHHDGEHCPWCRLAAPDLMAPPPAPLALAATASHAAPAAIAVVFQPLSVYRPQQARGPPVSA